jgi:transcriptional regulator with XRE-family HTH domain
MLDSMQDRPQQKKEERKQLNWRDKQLADTIRWYRRNNSMTQEQLSEKLGVNVTYVSSIERYKRGVSLSILYKLSRIFHIKVKDLFDF